MEQKEKEWKGKIVLIALNPKQQAVRLCPLPSKQTGKIYTGQTYKRKTDGTFEGDFPLTSEGEPYIITSATVITIFRRMELDMDDPIDAANWKWMQKHPYIVLSKEHAEYNKDAVFYVENKAKESKNFVLIDKSTTKAKMALYEATAEQKRDLATVLGHRDAKTISETSLEAWISKALEIGTNHQRQTKIDTVLGFFDESQSEYYSAQMFFKEIVKEKIIYKGSGGVWRYGENKEDSIFLGRNEDAVIEWLQDVNNADIVEVMRDLLENKE